MKVNVLGFFCLVLFVLAGCANPPKSAHSPYFYEFTLSPQHRTETKDDFTLLSIRHDGQVRARINHTVYFARLGEPFVSRNGYYSEYTLKSVYQASGRVLIQGEGRAYHN